MRLVSAAGVFRHVWTTSISAANKIILQQTDILREEAPERCVGFMRLAWASSVSKACSGAELPVRVDIVFPGPGLPGWPGAGRRYASERLFRNMRRENEVAYGAPPWEVGPRDALTGADGAKRQRGRCWRVARVFLGGRFATLPPPHTHPPRVGWRYVGRGSRALALALVRCRFR